LILSSYIGSIGSGSSITCRALTHEIGHFLDLEHTWGSTNSPGVQCGDDGVSDTPITKGWNHCPSPSSSMLCNPGVEENYQNYMDYSYCTHMFTLGQANRMISALTSSTAQRNNLITNANLASTGVSTPFVVCAPKPDIIPNVPVMLCAGDSYTYKYYASNGHPTSWSWVFQGGTPGTSTDSVPVIQYLTPGTYSVTLTLSNASGSGNITKTNYVIVIPSATQYTGPQYTEGFENASSVMNDWTLINLQGNPWTRVTTAAATGSASFRLTNLNNTMGEIASAVSPTINLVNIPNAVLTFKLAFAQTATTNTDKFVMSISTDCGKTWIQRYRKAGTTLATAPVTTSSFVPTSTQWRTETANLAPYWGNSEVRFRFDMQNGGGNNIYLDNINIASPSTGIAEQLAGFSDFNIYPNPTEGNSLIAFSLKEATRLTIKVYDVVGKEVALIVDQNLDAGNHEYTFSAHEQLRSGMYFVTALIGNSSLVTQKLIVK
jgi:PKD repeat protein